MGTARQIIKRGAAAADVVARPRRGITVLIYHRVGRRSRTEVDLPTELFDEQMAYLAEHCDVLTLDDAVTLLEAAEPPTRDPVVVTFDDGTADFADEAVPVLQRHGVPATLYVATDFIEHQRDFPDVGHPLTWAALADSLTTGVVEVGSHTDTHVLLDRADAATARDELDRSIELIGERLGVEARHFAYPKALAGSAAAEREVRTRFRSAALAGTRPNRYGQTDLHRLGRSPVQLSDGMRWFRAKASGGMHAEDSVRRLVNKYRYRQLTQ